MYNRGKDLFSNRNKQKFVAAFMTGVVASGM